MTDPVSPRRRAQQLVQEAEALEEQERSDEALEAYLSATRADPTWSVPPYNLGLDAKYRGDWAESRRWNALAVQLDPENEAAVWNLGIAATAVGDWAEARRAWTLFGIDVGPGDGPIEMNLGPTPIRINLATDPEVIWTRRIDPARAVITGVPLPGSDRRPGDLLLHDGAPAGYRRLGQRDVAVFDELAVLERSTVRVFRVEIARVSEGDISDLVDLLDEASCVAEDWSAIRVLCQECSEGRPHEHAHEHERRAPKVEGTRELGVGAPDASTLEACVQRWLARGAHRVATRIVDVTAE